MESGNLLKTKMQRRPNATNDQIRQFIDEIIRYDYFQSEVNITEHEAKHGIGHSFMHSAIKLGYIDRIKKGKYRVKVRFTDEIIKKVKSYGKPKKEVKALNHSAPVGLFGPFSEDVIITVNAPKLLEGKVLVTINYV
jgi:hypothetical protein